MQMVWHALFQSQALRYVPGPVCVLRSSLWPPWSVARGDCRHHSLSGTRFSCSCEKSVQGGAAWDGQACLCRRGPGWTVALGVGNNIPRNRCARTHAPAMVHAVVGDDLGAPTGRRLPVGRGGGMKGLRPALNLIFKTKYGVTPRISHFKTTRKSHPKV